MRIERLGELGSAPVVLRAVADAASARGLPPPAALIGDWFGSCAVIAPSVAVTAVGLGEVFDVPPGSADTEAVGGGWFGYLSYPDAGADGLAATDSRGGRRLDRLRAASRPRRAMVVRKPFRRTASGLGVRRAADVACAAGIGRSPGVTPTATHTAAGYSACLEAIAAGEVYQACVCTQFVGRLDGAPVDFFVDAVERTSPARAAYVAGPWGAVASLSPELFLRRCR